MRGADTSRLELTPQSAGLYAMSLGLSPTFSDDHEMLKHGMVMYDALYAWCREVPGRDAQLAAEDELNGTSMGAVNGSRHELEPGIVKTVNLDNEQLLMIESPRGDFVCVIHRGAF